MSPLMKPKITIELIEKRQAVSRWDENRPQNKIFCGAPERHTVLRSKTVKTRDCNLSGCESACFARG